MAAVLALVSDAEYTARIDALRTQIEVTYAGHSTFFLRKKVECPACNTIVCSALGVLVPVPVWMRVSYSRVGSEFGRSSGWC